MLPLFIINPFSNYSIKGCYFIILSDGYDVTAVFSKSYKAAFADKNSDIYKNEANSFKTLVSSVWIIKT